MALLRYSFPSLSQWSGFDRLASLQDEVNRYFEAPATGWVPALDLYDEKESFVAIVELPGMKREDIHLTLHDGTLTVSGERSYENGEQEGKTFRRERSFGKFERTVGLPSLVDSSKVTASYKDGVLTVTLPKAEEAKPRQIAVNAD